MFSIRRFLQPGFRPRSINFSFFIRRVFAIIRSLQTDRISGFKFPAFVGIATLAFAAYPVILSAQKAEMPTEETKQGSIRIQHILVSGNTKTKAQIIRRELTFQAGDSLAYLDLMPQLEESRQQIMKTGLFNEVSLNVKNWKADSADIEIIVKERWYTFPFPIFELADRNFNVWWTEMRRDFARTDYGIRFYQENVRGRNEQLKAVVQFGYTQKFELFYSIPYIDRKQQYGIKYSLSFSRNREVGLATEDNKLFFYEEPDYIRQRFRTGLTFQHRKAAFNSHFLRTLFHQNWLGDSATAINPDYYLEGRTLQRYIEIRYNFITDRKDALSYPLRGYYNDLEIEKLGLGIFGDINMLSISNTLSQYKHLGRKYYFASLLKMKWSYPDVQPYYNQQAFGYQQDFVRGYELYVIDGQQFGLAKADLKYQLFAITLDNSPYVSLDKFDRIPLAVYLKIYADVGFVIDEYYHEHNPLNDDFLFGGGFGLDLATYYDMVLRVEYSINKLSEKGLYLHFKIDI